jgi:hypothetical protein
LTPGSCGTDQEALIRARSVNDGDFPLLALSAQPGVFRQFFPVNDLQSVPLRVSRAGQKPLEIRHESRLFLISRETELEKRTQPQRLGDFVFELAFGGLKRNMVQSSEVKLRRKWHTVLYLECG